MKIRARFSFYEPSFKLDEVYSFGVAIGERIDKEINGGLACTYADVGLLAQATCRHGDHLEFGTLFGGTAILVAATKKEFGMEGDVYTVDNRQYQAKLERTQNVSFPEDIIITNAMLFGVEDRIHIIEADTWPLPEPAKDMLFESAFIDAGHDYESCLRDFLSVSGRANIAIFHDYDCSHAGVVRAIEEAVQHPGWWLTHISHHTAIMEKRGDDYGKKARRLER